VSAGQVRTTHRVEMKMPVMLKFSTGRTLACETMDYSEGGVGVKLPGDLEVPLHEKVTVSLFRGDEEYAFPATVGFTAVGRVGLRFSALTREQEVRVRENHLLPRRCLDQLSEGRTPDAPATRLCDTCWW